jgi:hypothetical protein
MVYDINDKRSLEYWRCRRWFAAAAWEATEHLMGRLLPRRMILTVGDSVLLPPSYGKSLMPDMESGRAWR